MDVELVGRDGLEAALEDWGTLYERDPTATPFLSTGWARAWMRHWSPDAEPWLLRVTEGGELAGLAPLVLERRRGVRVLGMIGKEPGDYWDVLAEPARRAAVVAAVSAEMARRGRQWDLCMVNCIPAGSPTPGALAAAGLKVHHRAPIACPAIALPATFDEYLASMSRRRRADLRRHVRRIDGGEVTLHEVRDPAEVPRTVDMWQDLRRRQWKHLGKAISPEHLSDRFRAFMLDLLPRLIATGEALVWEFGHEDKVIAVYINFADDRAFYCYLGGFDPDFVSLGMGKVAHGEGIRSSIAAGRTVYDFTRGGEPYKYWYGATDVHVPALLVGHRGPRSRLVLAGIGAAAQWRDRDRGHQDDPPAAGED